MTETTTTRRALVYGGSSGWIGGKIVAMLQGRLGWDVFSAKSRIENREAVLRELADTKPSHVFLAAGLTGVPNVDWCEDHKKEVVRANVIGALNIMDLCDSQGIHVTYFGTGCIYTYDSKYTVDRPVSEEDSPNFSGSWYSETKQMVDKLCRQYSGVLCLRLRMPISEDLHPRSLITKLCKYPKLIDIPNSMTVLPDLLPLSIQMAEKNLSGVYNFTNPGTISHNEIMTLYTKYVDKYHTWENFTEAEQNEVLKAKRSNTYLDTKKLLAAFPDIEIPHVKVAVERVLKNMKNYAHDLVNTRP